MPQVSAAVLRSTPSSTSASASIRRAAALFFSPLAALRSSEAVRSSRVIDTAAPIDAAPPQKQASSQSFTDLGIPNESQFRAAGISPSVRRPGEPAPAAGPIGFAGRRLFSPQTVWAALELAPHPS